MKTSSSVSATRRLVGHFTLWGEGKQNQEWQFCLYYKARADADPQTAMTLLRFTVLLNAKPAEVRSFLAGTVPGDRAREFTEQLRVAGVPI
jgi:hypothetical protein